MRSGVLLLTLMILTDCDSKQSHSVEQGSPPTATVVFDLGSSGSFYKVAPTPDGLHIVPISIDSMRG